MGNFEPPLPLQMQNTIHPVFNITLDKVELTHSYFSKLSMPIVVQATGEEPNAGEPNGEEAVANDR